MSSLKQCRIVKIVPKDVVNLVKTMQFKKQYTYCGDSQSWVNHAHKVGRNFESTFTTLYKYFCRAVGCLVVRASESRSEGLGSVSDATTYPSSIHGRRAR
ncbi:hypothetical protein TNCV_1993111 [Trichonephila clavipes]|nr:hypothetical protein TNCV_1993111 [Trichonephila clavipes]